MKNKQQNLKGINRSNQGDEEKPEAHLDQLNRQSTHQKSRQSHSCQTQTQQTFVIFDLMVSKGTKCTVPFLCG